MDLWATSTFQEGPYDEQPTEEPVKEQTQRDATRGDQCQDRERQEQLGAPVAAFVMCFVFSLYTLQGFGEQQVMPSML